ncbi:gliding motility-associated C-terminal domain-containing protein [Fulvivirgaceae bacterium PWU5]|uniref:Gliding motility-associated C-terminal domain-containing protein n=1 Tax=Dawidia cretensis TaxID=2782350 RepID=A0AAP2E1Z9_9BACT|nr:PKD domain-containing protein [Dawidia cretensis]MBT1711250.1 gliding motility-associated C-terminal domain-containing protein [Dawidia cretensis]
MTKYFYRLIFLLATVIPAGTYAQNFSGHNWYFGTRGIRFSRGDNSVSLITNRYTGPFGTGAGGTAVVSDPYTGTLLFYTDGVNVIDASHQVAPGGPMSGINTRNQSVAVCKNSSFPGEYYIFYATAVGGVQYALFDSTAMGNGTTFGQPPLGELESVNNTITGLPTGLSEGMIMLPDPNSNGYWLVLHASASATYHFVKIDNFGVNYIGPVPAGTINNAVNFSYHPATQTLGVSPGEAGRSIELATITFPPARVAPAPQTLPTLAVTSVPNSTSPTANGIYDTEFSSSGRYLYASRTTGGAGDVVQYDLKPDAVPPPTPASVLTASAPTASFGLQMGPDSVLYYLYASGGNTLLGGFTNTDTVASEVDYDASIFTGNFGAHQFPSFAPFDSVNWMLDFTIDGTCANSNISFFPTVKPQADSLVWNFGDGGTSSEWSPVYNYPDEGDYTVTMKAYLNGQVDSVQHPLTIQPFDAQISLVQDTTACSCELPFPKANPLPPNPPSSVNPCNRFTVTAQINAGSGGTPSWQWYGPAGPIGSPSSGTTATLQPDSAGYYFLVATVGACQTSAGVNIKEYNVQDQRANIWYFGNNAGIDFNPVFDNPPGAPEAISNPVMDALEGTSTISDRNGQVIFFTDGNTVWNHDFDVVGTNISGLNGNSSQAALIIPVPGDETLYYIFTTEEIPGTGTYRLAYSLYDIKLNFPTGGLRASNVTLFTRSTERITGNENWLIAHEYGNNIFRAYRITTAGIDNPIFSGIGSDHNIAFPANAEGYMRLGPQNRLAVPISTPGVSNIVEVFDFIDSAGTVTNLRTINMNTTAGQAYGVEFGAGGNKLYVSLLGSPSKLYEYAFDSLGIPRQPSATPRMSDADYPQGLGAIVMGPDQQIYVAVKDQPALGVITVVPDTARASTFQIDAFPLVGGTVSRLGLPNFIQIISDAPQGPSIAHTGECLGSPTNFTGSGTDPIDVLTWSFGDGGGESGINLTEVEHTYANPGTYYVVLSISNRCIGPVAIMRDTVIINPLPPDPSTVLSLCQPPMVIDANPTDTPGLTYLWEDGQTTETLTISEARTYFVTVTSTATGCSVEGTIRVNPALVTINLGPDAIVCAAPNTGQTLNTNININNHQWSLNGANLGNSGPTQPVDFSAPGTFTYIVSYTDPNPPGCFARDTITFTVNQSPTVTLTSGGPIACAANTGQLTAVVTQSTNYFYSFTGPTAIPNGSSPITGPFTGLTPGTYTITVNDQASGCPAGATETINGIGTPTITDVNTTVCLTQPQQVTITSTTSPFSTADVYIIQDAGTGAAIGAPQNVPAAGLSFQTAQALPPGNYNITVYIGGAPPAGCPTGASITLNQGPQIPNASIDVSALCTTQQLTALPAGAVSYTWSSVPAGIAGTGQTIPVATVTPGQYAVTVLIDDGTNCPTNATANISIEPAFFPEILPYDPCTNPVILTGTVNSVQPPASYFYTWTGPPGSGISASGMQLVATVEGDYTLRVQNPTSGCFGNPDAVLEDVRLLGPLTVVIAPPTSPPCDNAPFTLVAQPSRDVLTYQWSLNSTDISGQTTAQLADQRAAGLYGVHVSDGRCDASATLQIFLAPASPGLMQDNFVICPDPGAPVNVQTATLYPGPGFASYDWYELVGTSESSLNFYDTAYIASAAGRYRVRLENQFGCETSDDAIVEVDCEPVISAPNAFRPTSGLNANQMFQVFTFYVSEENFQVYIFNRWGEMVYESSDLAFNWNGGYKNNAGQLMPAGTYTYVLKYKSEEENAPVREKRGGVLLLR